MKFSPNPPEVPRSYHLFNNGAKCWLRASRPRHLLVTRERSVCQILSEGRNLPFSGGRNITSSDTMPWKRGVGSQRSLSDWHVDHLGFVLR